MNDLTQQTNGGLPTDFTPSLADPTLPIGVRIMLDEGLFHRVSALAKMMAEANGSTPQHLLGKPGACFDVISQALTWRLAPGAVAKSTYALPGGKMGYEGKLVQAIAESSGRMETGFEREYIGPWENVQGKFKIIKREKNEGGKTKTVEYPQATYTPEDEEGCGITIRCKLKGRARADEFTFFLRQAFPRNSTLWATDPKTQIYYTAIRRFMSVVAPSLVMGVPFQDDVLPDEIGPDAAKDVTPPAEQKPVTNLDELAETLPMETAPDPDEHEPTPAEPKFDHQQPGPDQQPKEEKKERAPTIKLMFRGRPCGRTQFLRDAAQSLKAMQSPEEWTTLQQEYWDACGTIDDTEQRQALWGETVALLAKYEPQPAEGSLV